MSEIIPDFIYLLIMAWLMNVYILWTLFYISTAIPKIKEIET